MTDKNLGLIAKYDVKRTDGRVKEDAAYFVLDLNNDPGALPAIHAYITWCLKNGYEQLAWDLEELLVNLGKANW
jgi:hypothetical protein